MSADRLTAINELKKLVDDAMANVSMLEVEAKGFNAHRENMDDKDVRRLEDRIEAANRESQLRIEAVNRESQLRLEVVNREGQLRLDAAISRIEAKLPGRGTIWAATITIVLAVIGSVVGVGALLTSASGNQLSAFQSGLASVQAIISAQQPKP